MNRAAFWFAAFSLVACIIDVIVNAVHSQGGSQTRLPLLQSVLQNAKDDQKALQEKPRTQRERNYTHCESVASLYPGVMVNTTSRFELGWVPDATGCAIKEFGLRGTAACVLEKYFVSFTDSLTRGIFRTRPSHNTWLRYDKKRSTHDIKRYHAKKRKFPEVKSGLYNGLEWVRTNSFNYLNHELFPENHPAFKHRHLERADVLLLNGGMWDMGMSFCGVRSFYIGAKKVIEHINSHKREDALFLVWPIHFVNIDRCPPSDLCYQCNSPEKASVFRKALRLAASCSNVSMIDTSPMTKQIPLHSSDGAHYSEDYAILESDILMNIACRDPPMAPLPPDPCPPGEEERLLSLWEKMKDVRVGCRSLNQTGQCKIGP